MPKLPEIKARPRAAQIFAVIIAGIIAVSMALTLGVIYVLLKLKIGTITAVVTSTTYMSIFTTVVGVGIAAYTSTKMLSPIVKINDAAKEVSRGDFSVRLEEKSIAKEIEEIATSFNIMVKELSNTETLRSDFGRSSVGKCFHCSNEGELARRIESLRDRACKHLAGLDACLAGEFHCQIVFLYPVVVESAHARLAGEQGLPALGCSATEG